MAYDNDDDCVLMPHVAAEMLRIKNSTMTRFLDRELISFVRVVGSRERIRRVIRPAVVEELLRSGDLPLTGWRQERWREASGWTPDVAEQWINDMHEQIKEQQRR